MRIGLEMFGTQTPSRQRGIGRYCRNLATALLARGLEHEFILLADSKGPIDLIPSAPNARLKLVAREPTLGDVMARLALENPDDLDLLVLLNPLELTPGYDIPPKPEGLKIAAVAYDLIPLIFQDDYLLQWPGETYARRYLRALDRLRSYDLIFTISEATGLDLHRLLNIPSERLVNIGTGADDPSLADDRTASLERFGLDRTPFLFSVGASDPRKNLEGLIEAFGRLPKTLSAPRKLAITASSQVHDRRRLEALAEHLGVLDRLVFTGSVDDPTLRSLYRACEVFVFPSLYEGFGLPIVEALRNGAVVLAGRNSSQIEAAGDAALLVNNADPASIAEGLSRLLTDPDLAQGFRDRGLEQSRKFRWSLCAQRLLEAVERPASKPVEIASRDRDLFPKASRIALVSPLHPNPSGIADYTQGLLEALELEHTVDLFHDGRGAPLARFKDRAGSCLDARVFGRFAKARHYDAILYQIGNSPHHLQAYEAALIHPGIVVLHDLALISFHYERLTRNGAGFDGFLRELALSHPERLEASRPRLQDWNDAPEAMVRELVREGVTMNRRLAERALALIVHSEWAASRLRALSPSIAAKTFVIPHGAEPRPRSPRAKAEARSRLDLPTDAFLIGVFGSLHPSKLNVETVEAFAELAKRSPEALLMMVGDEVDGGLARRKVRALGLESRVRFRGRPDDAEFLEWVAAADMAINLRRPPTNGETSGALLHLLSAGVPTIVTDVGSFGDYADHIVCKVAWPSDLEGTPLLQAALLDLAGSPLKREALGDAAIESIGAGHRWSRVASLYSDVMKYAKRASSRTGPPPRLFQEARLSS